MNKRKLLSWFLQSPEGDPSAAGGGGTADTGAGGGAAPADGGSAPAAGGGEPGTGEPVKTALEQGAAPDAGTPEPIAIPDKFLVKKDDGTVDHEASSLKMAEAYSNLEKRAGAGDLPPKSFEEYTVAVPDELKEKWIPAEDPLLQEFLKEAHANNLSQKQVDFMVNKYLDIAPGLIAATRELDAEECTTALKAEWKTDEEYKGNISKAWKAAHGIFGKDANDIITEYGNDPRVIRGLAKIGSEMREDSIPNFEGQQSQAEIDTLLTSEAYNRPSHPEHAKVSEQVRLHFEKLTAAAEKAGNVPLM